MITLRCVMSTFRGPGAHSHLHEITTITKVRRAEECEDARVLLQVRLVVQSCHDGGISSVALEQDCPAAERCTKRRHGHRMFTRRLPKCTAREAIADVFAETRNHVVVLAAKRVGV